MLGSFLWSRQVKIMRVSFQISMGWMGIEGKSYILANIRMERFLKEEMFWSLEAAILVWILRMTSQTMEQEHRLLIVVRGPVHVLTEEEVQLGMILLKSLSCEAVDKIIITLSQTIHGDLSTYGFQRPTTGPFLLKKKTGRSPIIDVGCIRKIKDREIEVLPSLTSIEGELVKFSNGNKKQFDAVIFATGYKSAVHNWLKNDGNLFNKDGMPKQNVPNHWKGENGIYCAGFARSGLFGISNDAQNVANDINMIIRQKQICLHIIFLNENDVMQV